MGGCGYSPWTLNLFLLKQAKQSLAVAVALNSLMEMGSSIYNANFQSAITYIATWTCTAELGLPYDVSLLMVPHSPKIPPFPLKASRQRSNGCAMPSFKARIPSHSSARVAATKQRHLNGFVAPSSMALRGYLLYYAVPVDFGCLCYFRSNV